jgi:hypothetical protein
MGGGSESKVGGSSLAHEAFDVVSTTSVAVDPWSSELPRVLETVQWRHD